MHHALNLGVMLFLVSLGQSESAQVLECLRGAVGHNLLAIRLRGQPASPRMLGTVVIEELA